LKPETSFEPDRATEIVDKSNNKDDLKISIDGSKEENKRDLSPAATAITEEAAVPEVQDKTKETNSKDNV